MWALAVLIALTVAMVAVGGTAAATQLAGLKLVPVNAEPGSTVKVTGTWFAAAGGQVVEAAPVQLWWGRDGERLLTEVQPDSGGTFITRVTVPGDAPAGPHVVSATQMVTDAGGVTYPAPGSPARAQFVVGATRNTSPLSPPEANAAPSGDGRAGVLLAVTVAGFGVAGVGGGLLARDAGHRNGNSRRRDLV